MKVFFEFPVGAEVSAISAMSAMTVWDSAGVSAEYTPSSIFSIVSGDLVDATTGGDMSAAMRKWWIDFPVYDPTGSDEAVSPVAYNLDVYTYLADGSSGVTNEDNRYVVGQFDTIEEGRSIMSFLTIQSINTITTGSKVVNTTLNEYTIYSDNPAANGIVDPSDARAKILARYKLYDSYGQATSINPVIREASQVGGLLDWIVEYSSGAGSGFK